MAATGNEVVRLEQLKRLQPQIVSFLGTSEASITLGNGKTVEFWCTNGGSTNGHLLVRAMYNSFELLQGTTDGTNKLITVRATGSMKTLKVKTGQADEGKFYGITNNTANGALTSFTFTPGNTFNFAISTNLVVFIGAVIYVE